MFFNAACDKTVQMRFRSGVRLSSRLCYSICFNCGKVTISCLDHAAGNLELSPKPSANLLRGNQHRELVKMQLRVSAQELFGVLAASSGLMRSGLVLPLVSWNFWGFCILPSIEFD